MNTTHRRIAWLAVLFTLCVSRTVSAQTAPATNPWSHGTTLNVFAGVNSASSQGGSLAGGAVGWEVNRWLALEGIGSWLDRGTGAEAFAADLKAIISPVTARRFVPFVQGGIGMYRASFDLSRAEIPDFYRPRLAAAASDVNSTVTLTDPSFIVGGGANLFMTQHVAIRPDVRATIVRRDARSYVLTTVAVHLAYHFETHPVAQGHR
jgi:Outer membrane protein beta-barrel domain